jgi:hypothetical protein
MERSSLLAHFQTFQSVQNVGIAHDSLVLMQAAALSRRESVDSPGAEHTREQQGWLSWVSWGLLGAGGSSIDAGGFTGAISDKDLKVRCGAWTRDGVVKQ